MRFNVIIKTKIYDIKTNSKSQGCVKISSNTNNSRKEKQRNNDEKHKGLIKIKKLPRICLRSLHNIL